MVGHNEYDWKQTNWILIAVPIGRKRTLLESHERIIVLNKMIFTWDMCAILPFVNWISGCPKNASRICSFVYCCTVFFSLPSFTLSLSLCFWCLLLLNFFSMLFDNAYALWKSLQLMRVDLSLYPFIYIHCDAMRCHLFIACNNSFVNVWPLSYHTQCIIAACCCWFIFFFFIKSITTETDEDVTHIYTYAFVVRFWFGIDNRRVNNYILYSAILRNSTNCTRQFWYLMGCIVSETFYCAPYWHSLKTFQELYIVLLREPPTSSPTYLQFYSHNFNTLACFYLVW